MKKILLAVLLLSGCASGGLTEDEAVDNVREAIGTTKSDADIKDTMHSVCELLDDIGPGLIITILKGDGYTSEEVSALLDNSKAAYCPDAG